MYPRYGLIHHNPPTIPVDAPKVESKRGKWDCPHCHGGYVVLYDGGPTLPCDECNGTGIKGDPRLGAIVIALSVVTTIVPLVWWLWP